MKRLAIISVVVLLAGCFSSALYAQDYESLEIPELSFQPPEVERFEIDNGLVVYFLEDHTLPVVALDAVLREGGIYVPASKTGLAELYGTVLRTGGTTVTPPSDFDEQLDFVGARLRSSCGIESGEVSLRILKKDVDLGFRLMAEMITSPLFDAEKLDIAKENKLEEIRRENDQPNTITRREFYRMLFPDHPYGRSATEQTVSAVAQQDLADFHASFCHPNNCIMALSGDLTLDEARALINEYYGDWAKSEADLPEFPQLSDPQFGVYHIHKDLNQTSFRIGHVGIGRSNPDRYAVEIMNYILGGGGFLSRMTNKIRVQEGLAYSVGSNFYQMDESGSFYAYCQTKGESTARAIELMIAEIRGFIDSGATEKELETAKNSILNSDIFNYATPHQIAVQQAMLEFNGFPPDQLVKRIEEIKAVTLDDVKTAAEKYLHPDNLIFIVVGDESIYDKPLTAFGEVSTIEL